MDNLNKLTKLLGADRIMTADDVQQILLGIMEILKSYKQGTESINEDTKTVVNSLLEKVVQSNQETLDKAETVLDSRMKDVENLLKDLNQMINDVEVLASNVKDGKDADEEKVVEDVIARIKIDPTVITVSAQEVRDKLASLKDEDRLDKSSIKGLEKILLQKDLDYAIATLQHQTSFLINKGGLKVVSHDASLSGDGTPESPLVVESTSGLTLKTNGTDNGSQTILNLEAGTNITLTDNGTGTVTIDAAGGSGSPGGSDTQLQYNNAGSFGGITGATTDGTSVTLTAPTIATSQTNSYATASTIGIFNGSKQLISADTATYPSLNELAFLKGVTSAIQTQLNAKGAGTVTSVSSTNGDLTVATGTTTPALTVNSAPILTTARTIGTITGDATSAGSSFNGSANNTNALTLATVNSNVGSFGSATAAGTFTVNAKGLITAASSTTITPAVGSITGLGTGVATALAVNVGSAGAFVTFNGALGTPSSGTLTNATGLPIAGLVSSTSTALGVGSLELGHASDTTLSRSAAGQLAVEGVDVLTTSNTKTVTNKRPQPRTASSTTASTLTPDLSSANVYYRTTQTASLTINAPTGTPVIGETIAIYVDSAGAQTLTMDSTYKVFGAAFPASTTAGKTLMITAQYNGTDWKTLWATAI